MPIVVSGRSRTDGSFFSLVPALVVALIAFIGGAVAYYAPPVTGEIAVLFPPSYGEAAAYSAIVAAGGRIVGPSHLPNIAVAYTQDPTFAARISANGALLLMAAKGLCAPRLDDQKV